MMYESLVLRIGGMRSGHAVSKSVSGSPVESTHSNTAKAPGRVVAHGAGSVMRSALLEEDSRMARRPAGVMRVEETVC